ncbi:hypothetical protein C1645_777385 [Glomus cerebriforme]|uniref:C2H2-type domain-containing protein n=1 Tax=Glomus cerebriforme TaxID=658196 RepID=A0A397SNY6_9GLOM|nr:hypothetical protein C1645_777385 [Glomus cerebriforme]
MSLSEDCIWEILQYLSDDKKSLYSCLLTNRLFCRIVVQILWRNPWNQWININYKCDDDSREQIYWNSLGRTISKCFSKEIKQSSSLLKKHKQNRLLQQQPLFNYVSYIQIISAEVIDKLIKYIFDDINNRQTEQKFNKKFWLFFMNRCSRIKSLNMPRFNLFEYPASKISLSSLSTLKVIVSYPKEIIFELSKNINTLKRIEFRLDNTIGNSNNDDNIKTLILSQKNLKEIKFIFFREHTLFFNQDMIKQLSQTLRVLELCNCTFIPIQTISNFINITELKICFNSFMYNGEGVNNLRDVFLPKLETLSLINFRDRDLIFLSKLIETTQGSLKILNVHTNSTDTTPAILFSISGLLLPTSPILLPTSSIKLYLHTIQTACPNIEVLPVWLNSETVLQDFEDLLKSCSKIRKIIIHATTPFNDIPTKSILDLLALKSSSLFLNNIHLIGQWKFSNSELENFFDLWKEMKRKPIECFSHNNVYYIYIKSNYIIKYFQQYKCIICSKAFDRLESANHHIIIHHFGSCPYKCWNDCGDDHLSNFIYITSNYC